MIINRQYISEVNTYPGKNNPKYIVIHETDNFNAGAGAKRHAEAQFNGHLKNMSAHYYVGSDGIYQAAEHKDGTWSIGKEYGGNHSVTDAFNLNSINIEICVNPDGDYNKARANAIELVKHLIKITGLPAERVIRHFDAKGKYCPRKMMDNPALWEDFKKQISEGAAVEPSAETKNESSTSSTYPEVPFMVRVIIDDLNYRSEPKMGDEYIKGVTGKGSFTIVEVDGNWGKLKSGAGWIYLGNPDYCIIVDSEQDEKIAPVKKIKAGDKFVLDKVLAYNSPKGATIGERSGVYYAWEDEPTDRNRIKMTNRLDRVGVEKQVSFFVAIEDLK